MSTEPKSTARRDKTDEWDFRKPVTEPVDLRKETECTCDPEYAHRCPRCGGRGYVRREAMSTEPKIALIRSAVENYCGHPWPEGKPLPEVCPECDQIVQAVAQTLRESVNWREGESAPAQTTCPTCYSQVESIRLCLKCGTNHGFVLYSNRICGPKEECQDSWHKPVPPAVGTAMTARQFDEKFRFDIDTYSGVLEFAEAYAAHVREAAQGEIDKLREEVADHTKWLMKDTIRKHDMGLRTHGDGMFYNERAETAERKLAELEKAAFALHDKLKIILPKVDAMIGFQSMRTGMHTYDGPNIKEEMKLLASLRAESKEPVD